MKKLDEITFSAELISETSLSPVPTQLGKHESTMTLYGGFEHDPDYYLIEWDIPDLDIVEEIGIWCESGTKEIKDYDGVFSIPEKGITLLQDNDFDTSYAE